jgi:membrane-bound ClpP family serine protease
MNALALWIPGTLLFVAGILLLVFEQVGFNAGLAIAAVGIALETVGVLLWVKQRKAANRG